MRTKVDELRGRLAKLEKLAGKGACPFCRIYRRHSWLDSTRPQPKPKDPSQFVTARCDLCDAPSRVDISSYPEELRELVRLYFRFKLEDTYTDQRACAAQRWMLYCGMALQQQRKVVQLIRKLSEPAAKSSYQQLGYAQQQTEREREQERAKDRDVKRYNDLFAEMRLILQRRQKRLKRQYGANPFPELVARLVAAEKPDYDLMYKGEPYEHDVPFSPKYEIGQEAKMWVQCAELEKIILGDVSAHTAGKLEDCERRVREVIAVAKAKHEAREEKRRQD